MRPSRVVRIVSLAVAFLLPGTIAAAADEPLPPVTPFIDSEPAPPSKWKGNAPVTPDPATTQPSRWYGGQIIAADLATLACFALVQHGTCGVAYLFAAPAIHGAHGRLGRAGLSVAMRLYVPAIGGVVGHVIGGCPSHEEPSPRPPPTENDMRIIPDFHIHIPCSELVVGALVGVAVGMALDAALAFTSSPAPVADAPSRSAVRFAPRLSLGQAHLTLGLSATF